MTEHVRPKVITDLLAVDDTGTVANYIRQLEASLAQLHAAQGSLIGQWEAESRVTADTSRAYEKANTLLQCAKELAALSTPALTPQEDDLTRVDGVSGSEHGDLPRRAMGDK